MNGDYDHQQNIYSNLPMMVKLYSLYSDLSMTVKLTLSMRKLKKQAQVFAISFIKTI